MFENAQIGDRVWSFPDGWSKIVEIANGNYPIRVKFENNAIDSFMINGIAYYGNINPTLFWNEIKFTIPKKPLPNLKVDAKVIVWNDDELVKYKAHFKELNDDGKIVCFANGTTSFSAYGEISKWDSYELVENTK